ncbi:MAG: FHA domain-containing protein [Synergistaceae bacterium]|nr:FHA domain-containing protein [Synergistaceae bacterium]
MTVNLIKDGHVRVCPVGFSWTMFFFGFLVPLFRGDIAWFFISLTTTIVGGQFVLCFLYNRIYINSLVAKGYIPADDYSEQCLINLNIYRGKPYNDDDVTAVATPCATPIIVHENTPSPRTEIILFGEKGCFQGMTMPIYHFPAKIGRDASQCKIQFPEGTEGVSRVHCTIYNSNDGFTVVDSSTYGTFINGQMLSPNTPVRLNNGDYLEIGSSNQVFSVTF